MNIGAAIKRLRKNKQMSQKDLATACDLSVNAISQIEKNISFPKKDNIDKICKALDVPVGYLLFFSINDEDVPENKREAFKSLSPIMERVLLNG